LATHQAIAAVSQALQGLLERALPKAAYPTAQVKLLQPADFSDGMADGISLLLYRIGVNTSLRDLPPRTLRDGNRFRPSPPLEQWFSLWDRLKPNVTTSMTYLVRMVQLDSESPIGSTPGSSGGKRDLPGCVQGNEETHG
jgi:hypothetical protein